MYVERNISGPLFELNYKVYYKILIVSLSVKHSRTKSAKYTKRSNIQNKLRVAVMHIADHIGWYPELVFLIVVFPNSTELAVVISNSAVLELFLPYQSYFLAEVGLNNTLNVFNTSINRWLYFVAVVCWKTFHKTLMLGNTHVEIVVLNNNTDWNTSSEYHPLFETISGGFS